MSRNQNEVDTLEYKLGKRGFLKDPRPVQCDSCGERARFSYAIKHTNIGGRWIEWCHACQEERGFRRGGDGEPVEDADFDLEQFLA